MKLTSDKSTVAEYKALILYILYKVNKPLTNNEFLKLVLSVTDINYFYFQQFLLDLIESKYISSTQNSNNILYQITPEGIETLKLTKDIIPGIIKLKVDKDFKSELDTIENEVSVTAEYFPKNEKSYMVKCKIVENSEIMFELNIFAGSNEKAKFLVDNWKNNAVDIYPKIINLLNNGE